MVIEVEIRSFISKEKYQELLNYFTKEGQLIKKEKDETEYYAKHGAVRLWRNQDSAKVILKSGSIHDEYREEKEIAIQEKDYSLLQSMFAKLNIPKHIKWYRIRHTFNWQDVSIQLGDNKGYGYIIELEKLTDEKNKEQTLKLLKQKLSKLNIPLTSREEFEKKYENYKKNWKTLIGDN